MTDRPLNVTLAGNQSRQDRPRTRIVVIAEPSAVFEGLTEVIRKELSGCDAELRQSLRSDGPPVALTLVQASALPDPMAALTDVRQRFPHAPLALVFGVLDRHLPDLEHIIAHRLVQGVLSLAQPMVVWAAALRLLLSGEEYFPASILHQNLARSPIDGDVARTGEQSNDVLTPREHQVLNYMAKGYQNKIIAAQMQLSEHTVKIHVRNVIRKLHVHNRTQAASTYLNTLKGQSGPAPLTPRTPRTLD